MAPARDRAEGRLRSCQSTCAMRERRGWCYIPVPSLGTPPAGTLPASELVEFSATEVPAISPDFPSILRLLFVYSPSRIHFFQEPELYEREMTIVGWSSPLDKVYWSYGEKLGGDLEKRTEQAGKLKDSSDVYHKKLEERRQDVLIREAGVNRREEEGQENFSTVQSRLHRDRSPFARYL